MLGYERDVCRFQYFPCVYSSETCYSTRYHMGGHQSQRQLVRVTGGMSAEREREGGPKRETKTMVE